MRLIIALTAGTLGTLALLLVETPWSDPAALPVSLMLLLPFGILLAGVFEVVWHRAESMLRRPKRSSPAARWCGWIAAALMGGAILFGGAIISNLAFVDEPVEGNTLVGYAVSSVLGLGSTVLLGRSKTFREVCASVDPARALIFVPILLGIALAVVDALVFPSHYGDLHRLLEVAALGSFVLGIRVALAGPRGDALSARGKIAAALAAVTLLTSLSATIHDDFRGASVEAALQWPTAHRRIVTSVRDLIDADGDGHSPLLGGGDCDDGDPSAHPMSTNGDPCMDLSVNPERPVLERSEALDASYIPNVLVWVTVDAFRCGFGGRMEERRELKDICPELAALAEDGRFGTARATSSATRDSLRAMHSLGAERPSQERGFFVNRLGELGFHRVMVPATRLVVRSPADRGEYDEIVDDLLQDAGSRATTAPHQTDLVVDVLRRAVGQHERVFLWAHYYDPHAPYVHDSSKPIVLDSDVSRYCTEVRRTDAAVARLARSLRDALGRSDVVLLVTADHSEEFGEHGGTRHSANLYETSVRIPVLLWRTTEDLVHWGLPTLLPVGGHQIGDYFVALATGTPFARRNEVYMHVDTDGDDQVGVVVGQTKLIHRVSLGYSELYDLEEDPWEQVNLAATRPGEVRRLLSLIRADGMR